MNKWVFLFFSIIISIDVFAQVELVPIRKDKFTEQTTNRSGRNSRIAQDTLTLSLPFFDDFSSADKVPDTLRWLNSEIVAISTGLGINPPSLNVAVLDGVDDFGRPYNSTSDIPQVVDVLTSQFIDLSGFDQDSDIFLSFFWQLEGRGETPDQDDELRVQFKDRDGQWITMETISGDTEQDPNSFDFLDIGLLTLADSVFFHSEFQFRLQAFGDPRGIFDFWLVDYFRMEAGRFSNDLFFVDQSFVSQPSSFLGDLTAIPLDHFLEGSVALDSSQAEIVILNNELFDGEADPPVTVTTQLLDTETGTIIQSLTPRTILVEDVFQSAEFNSEVPSSDLLTDFFLADEERDSFNIETLMFFEEDTAAVFPDNVINDTVRSITNFTDFYAYDDGEAEQGFGIRQSAGQVALRYVIQKRDLLNQFDVYFPPTDANPGPILFFVRTELTNDDTGLLYIDQIERSPSQYLASGLNQFVSIRLERTVSVEDTIFIGYQQLQNDRVFVGYDRNTDTRDAVFQNISGSWIPLDPSTEPGSIMIRPIFLESSEIITSVNRDILEQSISIYPNPSSGTFNIEGRFDTYELYDLSGTKVLEGSDSRIDIKSFKSGLYLLRLNIEGDIITKKLILNHD